MNGDILLEAHALINGERQEAYGSPAESFGRVAAMWSVYLDSSVSAKDVCLMMAMLKLCREMNAHTHDNLLDAAGYLGLAADMGGWTVKIIIDTREQAPYCFAPPKYEGVTVQTATLVTGDYSLAGLQDRIALERKSLDDLTGTLTKGRERFERECERGRGFDYFGVIIEAALEDVRAHRYQSQMTPQALLQSLAAFSVRYGLHVHWCGTRSGGEYMVHSLLSKYLREAENRLASIVKAHGSPVEAGCVPI